MYVLMPTRSSFLSIVRVRISYRVVMVQHVLHPGAIIEHRAHRQEVAVPAALLVRCWIRYHSGIFTAVQASTCFDHRANNAGELLLERLELLQVVAHLNPVKERWVRSCGALHLAQHVVERAVAPRG